MMAKKNATPRPMDLNKIERGVRLILEGTGEDPERPGIKATPTRVAHMFAEILGGINENPEKHLRVIQHERHDEMVLIKNIPLYSMCEHHMLPFFGHCHIGYLPSGRVFGVSKLARLVDVFARRLQLQERLTEQISRAIMDAIQPVGVGVMIEAQHLCMMMRGVEKQHAVMTTSSLLGSFRENLATRQEFLALINRPQP